MRRRLLFVAVFVLGVVALLVVVSIQQRPLSAKLEVEITPSDSTLMVSGEEHKEGVIKVKPGNYTINVSRQGFESVSTTVSASKGQTRYVGVVLVSNSPSTQDWYEAHPEDAKKAEGISSRNFDQSSESRAQEMPILKELPWIDHLYRVDYGPSQRNPNDGEAIALYVTHYSEAGRNQALEWLKFKGHTSENTEIIIKASTQP